MENLLYFLYCVQVLCSCRLSSDGRRTLLVDLDSPDLKPEQWDALALEKSELSSFSDISIYELHIRDFRLLNHSHYLNVGNF